MKLTNKIAIVTGASGNGLERSIALTLAKEGANKEYDLVSETIKQWGRTIGIQALANPASPSYSYNAAKQTRTEGLLKSTTPEFQ